MAKPIDAIIAGTLKVEERALTGDLKYGSVEGWDSLGHVSLMLAIESEYQVEIDEDTMVELTTVRAVREFVKNIAIQ